MKITKTVLEPKEEVVAIKCDRCLIEYSDPMEIQEFLLIDFVGGYGSAFEDGDRIQADICQYCLKGWLGNSYRTTDLSEDW